MVEHSRIPSLAHARSILRDVDYVGDVDIRGHAWLTHEYLPCLRRLARSQRKSDRLLASIGYYVLGDVHYVHDAPRAAIRAYRRCLSLDPNQAAAWREIGGCLQFTGEYIRARNALRKSVRVDPDDDLAESDLEGAEWDLRNPRPPLYREGDAYWESSELLASGRYSAALAILGRKVSSKARRWRARVYAAMHDGGRALREWRAIVAMGGRITIEEADCFFLRGAMWDLAEFWQMMLEAASRCWNLCPCRHEGLPLGSHSLCARYHLARINGDTRAASRLAAKYPKWKEPARLVRMLNRRSKSRATAGQPCIPEVVVRPPLSERREWRPIRGHT
jgi:tetratricopeptide (TPR) repeat protein